jgi:hypothetical protein
MASYALTTNRKRMSMCLHQAGGTQSYSVPESMDGFVMEGDETIASEWLYLQHSTTLPVTTTCPCHIGVSSVTSSLQFEVEHNNSKCYCSSVVFEGSSHS